jgi:hypothetical protein
MTPDHIFERDKAFPEWHGWHAARRGLGTNLYRLGVPEKTIQAILRHANVSTTNTYYIKSAAEDTRVAMAKLESLVIGNDLAVENSVSDNEVATNAQKPKLSFFNNCLRFWLLNLGGGGRTRTYDLRIMRPSL